MQGTLELLVAAPVPLGGAVLADHDRERASFGIYGLARRRSPGGDSLFGIPITIDQPARVRRRRCSSRIVAIGLLGLITASTFVLYRAAFYLGIALQYPIYIACGLILPLAILPGWLGPISWVLAPTWGFRALTDAARRRQSLARDRDVPAASASSTSRSRSRASWFFERLARDRATLRLA